jgi:hypothetical protein
MSERKKQAMRWKELSVELQDRIVSDLGKGTKTFLQYLRTQWNTMASIILKWKKLGNTKTLPRAELNNRGRRALVREVTKNPMVTLTEI